MSDLLNCPFCGGEAEWKSGGPGCAWVSCKDCPAETGDGTIDRVKKSWNNRTPDPAVQALVEAAKRISFNYHYGKGSKEFGAAYDALDAALAAFGKMEKPHD